MVENAQLLKITCVVIFYTCCEDQGKMFTMHYEAFIVLLNFKTQNPRVVEYHNLNIWGNPFTWSFYVLLNLSVVHMVSCLFCKPQTCVFNVFSSM